MYNCICILIRFPDSATFAIFVDFVHFTHSLKKYIISHFLDTVIG